MHISTNSLNGGAGIAATRIQEAIYKNKSFNSIFYSEYFKNQNLNFYYFENKLRTFYRRSLCKIFRILIQKNSFLKKNIESYSFLPIIPSNNLQKFKADIYNLHWVQHEFLSLREIKKLPKGRIVWTLHDCWLLSGTTHYPDKINKPKYYKKLNRFLKNHKEKLVKEKDIQIVAPSNWMKKLVLKNFKNFTPKITVIPYPVPDIFFKKYSKTLSRKKLNLPQDKIIILFSSLSGEDERKGLNKVCELLLNKEIKKSNILFITIGQINNLKKFRNLIHLGIIKNQQDLLEIYKASDIVLVPSIIDNLPQVALEAQACGKPVVGFKSGGIEDIVVNGKTGYLSEEKNIAKLIDSINLVIKNGLYKNKNSLEISKRAKRLWGSEIISKSYVNLYKKCLDI